MDESLLDNILNELQSIGYTGEICLNVYNEPTANMPYLLRVLAKIKSQLPRCRIYFSTNGDYLEDADFRKFRILRREGFPVSGGAQVAASYDGTVMPCCNFFPEDERHKKYVCANVGETGVVGAYFPKLFTAFRKQHLKFFGKASPCDTCSNDCYTLTAQEAAQAISCCVASIFTRTRGNSPEHYTHRERAKGILPGLATS